MATYCEAQASFEIISVNYAAVPVMCGRTRVSAVISKLLPLQTCDFTGIRLNVYCL